MSSHKKNSFVWASFDKVDDRSVQCRLCFAKLAVSGCSTGSMINHLKYKHGITGCSKKTSSSSSGSEQKMMTTSFDAAAFEQFSIEPIGLSPFEPSQPEPLSDLIINMTVKDVLPLSVIEGEGFRDLIGFLSPSYRFPSRLEFSARLNALYEERRNYVSAKLLAVSSVALTTECWTNSAENTYVTVTCHYIDSAFQKQAILLATREIDAHKTISVMKATIESIATDFGIMNKITAIVHGDGCDLNEVATAVNSEDIVCSTYVIQQIVAIGLKTSEIAQCMAAAARLVSHFRHGRAAAAGLLQKQLAMNLPQHQLLQCNESRWTSQYEMLERLLEQKWAICGVLDDKMCTTLQEKRAVDMTEEYWRTAEELRTVLKPLYLASIFLAGEIASFCPLSALLPVVRSLVDKHMTSFSDDESPALKTFKATVRSELINRFKLENLGQSSAVSTGIIAAALDPRYKTLSFVADYVREEVYLKLKTHVAFEQQQLLQQQLGMSQFNNIKQEPLDGFAKEPGLDLPAKKMRSSALEFLFGKSVRHRYLLLGLECLINSL